MNFNSLEFAVFFSSLLLVYAWVFRRTTARNVTLLVASYLFYMSWDWRYAGLIAFSTGVDYLIGLRMAATSERSARRLLVTLSLVVNLGLLGLFKYFNFFVDLGTESLGLFGLDVTGVRHELLLPVGISFYTFQTLSYTLDLYRGAIEPERDPLRFAVYVSFFPQLVAGPIVRAAEFLPQLRATPDVTRDRFDEGFTLVFQGLFKKVVIADLLAGLGVDAVFASPADFSSLDLLLALYGYTFQIYNDFSGYSDIAIGAARVMGFDLPENFNRPYQSQNVREFWTRWHISLSSWLRDYLYISLGGNRSGPVRTRLNLMWTMLLGGLWHGAALNFVLWGAYHGLLLVLAGRGADRTPRTSGARRLLNQVVTFHLVVFGWLLFRVHDWPQFTAYVRGLAAGTWDTRLHLAYVAVLGLAIVTHVVPRDWVARGRASLVARPAAVQAALYAALLLGYVGATLGAPAFIYFQF